MFYHSSLRRAFRATSDDTEIAQLMGLDNRKVYAWAMALCLGVVAVAGVFLAIRSNFDPFMGLERLIFGFESVIIGGLGNLWGTLVGGVILGVAQGLGAQIDSGISTPCRARSLSHSACLPPHRAISEDRRMRTVTRSTRLSTIAGFIALILVATLIAAP